MDPLERLADALRERGFSLRYSIRVTAFERLDAGLIDAVSRLTGIRGQEAQAALLGAAVLVEGLAPEFVEDAAALLREQDASVAIELSDARLFAYLPDHPARGDQPLRRLAVVGLGYEVDTGRLGDWMPPSPTPCPNLDELLAAVDRTRETWASEGLHEAACERSVLERVSAREPALERRIAASEGAERAEAATIYADWLQAQGDARGLIGAAAAVLADAEVGGDPRAVTAAQRELDERCSAHPSHLFGGGRALIFGSHEAELRPPTAKLTWTGPALASLTLDDGLGDASGAQLAALLAAPACACLRELVLGRRFGGEAQLGAVLATAPCAASLRELSVGSRGVLLGGDAFERLERLLVIGGGCRLGPARLPALRELVLELWPSDEHDAIELEAPMLTRLVIHLEPFTYPLDEPPLRDSLGALLELPTFARLRELSLAVSAWLPAEAFVGFAELLETCPASATLEHVDLREVEVPVWCRVELERLGERVILRD